MCNLVLGRTHDKWVNTWIQNVWNLKNWPEENNAQAQDWRHIIPHPHNLCLGIIFVNGMMRWLTIDIFMAIFDDLCSLCWFWSKNWWTLEKNKDDCFKMSTCVFRWNPMPYQFWQLAEQITSIRHILQTSCCWLFASNISRSKGQLLQAFVTRTNHQCKILWKRPLRGLDKQYIRKLFLKKKYEQENEIECISY